MAKCGATTCGSEIGVGVQVRRLGDGHGGRAAVDTRFFDHVQ